MLLIVYNKKICREVVLPKIFNADYDLRLPADEYRMADSLLLRMESRPEGWVLHDTREYSVWTKNQRENAHILKDGDIVNIKVKDKEELFVMVCDLPLTFHVMQKYDLSSSSLVTIGKNPSSMVCFDYMGLISADHGELRQSHGHWYIIDHSSNGIFVNHIRVNRSQILRMGDDIQIFGLHMLFLSPFLLINANCGNLVIHGLEDLKIPEVDVNKLRYGTHTQELFNRPPRVMPSLYHEKVEIEEVPAPQQTKKKPLMLVIGPSVAIVIVFLIGFALIFMSDGSGLMMVSGLVMMIGSSLSGIIFAIWNRKYDSDQELKEETHRFNAYSAYLIQTSNQIRKMYMANTAMEQQLYPSAKQVIHYGRHGGRLWDRSIMHEDFLKIRLGTGDEPFQVEIEVPKQKFSLSNDSLALKPAMVAKEFHTLHQVPVCINLKEIQLVGLNAAHKKERSVELMHVMAAQIAATHCYTDVKMVFLYDEKTDSMDDWECMRWYPHVWNENHSMRYMAANDVERRDVLFDIGNVIRARSDQKSKDPVKPWYVIFVSDPSLLNDETAANFLCSPLPSYGVTTIVMAEDPSQLPRGCNCIINYDGRNGYIEDLSHNNRTDFVSDHISVPEVDAFGKKLADIHVRELDEHSEIPESLTFLEMYNVQKTNELNIAERWMKNRTYLSMKAVIGRKAGNKDCYLDVHEKFHGPHGLVAGTTGSGKSETLQTYILSMAVNFSPEDVSFFIIDFKGGGMANLFQNLPHLAGYISNLSGNQIQRAMISIKSENVRRQKLFARYGVNNINLYTQLYKNHETDTPIPHLFIIIDEFAELKREEPEFMSELISVAQVGRSLGVHLILSTQKPSGTVDDNIWSNTRFRLCLRVQDRQDSMDMLHRPDAAFLTRAGEAFLQVGNDEIFERFQSGYSGAIYTEDGEPSVTALIDRTGQAAFFAPKNTASEAGVHQITQLDAVINEIQKVCDENDYAPSRQLWMPLLSNEIYLKDLVKDTPHFDNGKWPVPYKDEHIEIIAGEMDDPANQKQEPLVIDFSKNGHLAILGTAVSGKSTFMQTLAYALINQYSPDMVQMYLLDFSSHKLTPFASAPQVGGVVTDENMDRLDKFFNLLKVIMKERRQALKGGSFDQMVRVSGWQMPAIIIMLDNYEAFREKSEDKYNDLILQAARDGISEGIYLVLSAAGFGMSGIPSRTGDNIRTVVTLEQQEKFAYMDALRVSHIDLFPEANVHGRGLALADGRVLEFQTALALPAEDDFSRGEKIASLSAEMNDAWDGKRPLKIPEIPENPTLELLKKEDGWKNSLEKGILPYGWNRKDASVYGMNLQKNYCYAIVGRHRSGKTNLMKVMLAGAYAMHAETVIVEKSSDYPEFKEPAEQTNSTYIQNASDLYAYLGQLLPEFKKRNIQKRSLMSQGMDEESIAEKMSENPPIMIFISSMNDFLDMVYNHDETVGDMSGFVENITEKGNLHNIFMIACIDQEETDVMSMYTAFDNFIYWQKGIAIGGSPVSQKVLDFSSLSYADQNRNMPRGMGWAVSDSEEGGIEVVIPLMKGFSL